MATFTAFGKEFASERDAVISLMDSVQVAEACAGTAINIWIKTCKIPELRGGLRIIAEREAFHGRVFQHGSMIWAPNAPPNSTRSARAPKR